MHGRSVSRVSVWALAVALALATASVVLADVPDVGNVDSPSHPSDNTWYSDDAPVFSWDAARDLPRLLGSIDTSGNTFDVTVAGDVAYVADQEYGVHAVDVSEPGTPTLLGTYDTAGRAREIVVAGDIAYVADRQSGVIVLDVSAPGTPTLLGSYPTAGYALGVSVAGDTAYIAEQTNGLICVDVSDPSSPSYLGSATTTGTPRHVAVAGDVAYLADKDSGLQVFDVSDPTNPALIGSHPTPDNALGVAVAGDAAYVAAKNAGLQVFDVSDPSAPALLGSCETSGAVRFVKVDGDTAYLADKDLGQMQVIDVSDPSDPVWLSYAATPGQAYGLAVAGHTCYVGDWDAGLQTIQVSEPATPTLAGAVDTPDLAFGIAVDGDAAYVADVSSGLQVIDISDPSAPATIGAYATPSTARDVSVAGDTAYVADNVSGLQILDVSDPTTPSLLGSYDTTGFALAVDVAGDVAYVADHTYGLQLIDVSQPGTPTLLGTYDTSSIALGVKVTGDVAYVSDNATVQVVDVSDPTAPSLLGSYATPGIATTVDVAGDVAYVADKAAGLHVLDVSQPGTPTLLATYDTPDIALRHVVAGDIVYLADKASGLLSIDVSDPTSPTLLGSYTTTSDARDVVVAGDMAYVAAFDSGLQAIDIADGPLGFSHSIDQDASTTPDAMVDSVETTTTYAGRPDGANWFHVRAVGLRRVAGDPAHRRVLIDTTPPVTTSDAQPVSYGPVTVELAATDAHSGVAATYYKLDAATSWEMGESVEVETSGEHTLYYRSEDVAGNLEATQTVVFSNGVEIIRRGGRDRYAVGVDASRNNFANADHVILATGWTYADALSASGLAGCLQAPILVTLPERLPAEVEAEMVRLDPDKITIVGGPYSVNPSIEQHLRDDLGFDVERIGGRDRYAVSEAIATRVRGFGWDEGRLFMASGEVGADALSLSPVAYSARAPLVLTRRDVVPPETKRALEASEATLTVLAGGPVTVSDATLTRMEKMVGTRIERLWGVDRYATAAEVAEYGVASGICTYRYVGVANGADEKFADSLCGGPAVGINGGVMTLTQIDVLPSATRRVLGNARNTVVQVQVFGGPKSVSEKVIDDIATTLY
jgi:putative cell wall-binding protein